MSIFSNIVTRTLSTVSSLLSHIKLVPHGVKSPTLISKLSSVISPIAKTVSQKEKTHKNIKNNTTAVVIDFIAINREKYIYKIITKISQKTKKYYARAIIYSKIWK